MADHRVPNVTPADCKLIGAGDGSVMVYCQPCRSCLCPRATTLNAALGFWEEHATSEAHMVEVCRLCGRAPAEGEQHRQLYAVGETGEDAEEVCVGPDRHQLRYASTADVPDPWSLAAAVELEPPF